MPVLRPEGKVGMMDRLTVMGCLEGLTQDDWEQWYSDSEVQETAKTALALLKEQEEQIKQLEYDLAITQNNLNYYLNGND